MVTQGYSATYGARPLRRAVQRLIEDPVAEAVLDGYCAGGTLQLDADTSGNLLMRTLTLSLTPTLTMRTLTLTLTLL